jgi:hypothetical protein
VFGSRRLRTALSAATAVVAAAGWGASPASAVLVASPCSLHAATTGSDAAPGTSVAPLRTVQALVDRLRPGQAGCLAPGTYAGSVVVRRGGTAAAPVTLRAAYVKTATIRGQLRIDAGADHVTVSDLVLDGTSASGRPSPLVNGDDARFERNDVSSQTESCFVLGDKTWGIADRTLIARNHIHHCGVHGTNQDHGVYVRQARDTRITGNVIRENPDRGVQLFPNADRTVVAGNVIDRNGSGVIFSGDATDTSDDNRVEGNLVTASRLRWDVESYWYPEPGTGNVARGNCVFGGAHGAIQVPLVGFAATANVLRDPRLLRRSATAYALGAGSPCPVRPPAL